MKKYFLLFTLFCFVAIQAQDMRVPVDTTVITTNTVTIKGKRVSYKAQTGTQPVFDANGNTKATLFYTYYHRTDVTNSENRPLIMSFNGGPGSASVWMHIAYTGPKTLKIDDEGNPIQPYGIKNIPRPRFNSS